MGQFDQRLGDAVVDGFGAVIGRKGRDAKGTGCQDQAVFTDFLHGTPDLELGHLIDGVEVIEALKSGLSRPGARYPPAESPAAGGFSRNGGARSPRLRLHRR